eukprot:TRINITY_DN3489_c0_g1_i1.p1 TRINITY_DN3489_c0_g1~~TRINITY_DN3489_c0_g1_i1.p1  ORF type:complete len:106 (-),score=14.95 TRINITY_DN3489_c0_g1_i1:22-339(-)
MSEWTREEYLPETRIREGADPGVNESSRRLGMAYIPIPHLLRTWGFTFAAGTWTVVSLVGGFISVKTGNAALARRCMAGRIMGQAVTVGAVLFDTWRLTNSGPKF